MKDYPLLHSYELPEARTEYISSQVPFYMERRKPFLDCRYTICDLSKELNIPSYQLSAFFNRVLGCNFNCYINNLRIRYCMQLIENIDIERFNMHGLATECGFHNRNSFGAAFRKTTGMPPGQYLKILRHKPSAKGALV